MRSTDSQNRWVRVPSGDWSTVRLERDEAVRLLRRLKAWHKSEPGCGPYEPILHDAEAFLAALDNAAPPVVREEAD